MESKTQELKKLGIPNFRIYLVLAQESAGYTILGNQCTRLLELIQDHELDSKPLCSMDEGFMLACESAAEPDLKIYSGKDAQALMAKFGPKNGKGLLEFLRKFTFEEDAGF